jgi:hypothetical protein
MQLLNTQKSTLRYDKLTEEETYGRIDLHLYCIKKIDDGNVRIKQEEIDII